MCLFVLEPLVKSISHLEQTFCIHIGPGGVLLCAVLPVCRHYLFVPRHRPVGDEAGLSCMHSSWAIHEDQTARYFYHFPDSVDNQVDTPQKLVCCVGVLGSDVRDSRFRQASPIRATGTAAN